MSQRVDRKTRYERFKTLYETLPKPDRAITVQYMFYNVDANGDLDVASDPEFVHALKDVMLPPIV